MKYPAGKITGKDGSEVPIFVSDSGSWSATVGTHDLYESSRADLQAEIEKFTKRNVVKVEVPFTRISVQPGYLGGGLVRTNGVATGVHSANNNILATFTRRGNPMKEQIKIGRSSKNDGEFFEPLTKEQVQEFADLRTAKLAADRAYRAFIEEHGIDLREAVLKAIDEAKE